MSVLEDAKALFATMVTTESETDRRLRQIQETVDRQKEKLILGKENRLEEIFQGYVEVSPSEESLFISAMPKGNSVGDVMAKSVILLKEIDQSINERIGSVMQKMDENHAVLDMVREVLSIDEYKIILERYLKGYKWDFVPGRVMMSRSCCFYIHERAIKKLVDEWNRMEQYPS